MANTANANEFSEGQLWSYKSRQGEEDSRVLINKIEQDEKLGNIYHISIYDINLKNSRSETGVVEDLPHFPVSEETLDMSLDELIKVTQINSEYIEGYNSWKSAFDAREAGIFTISIAEIVEVIEESIRRYEKGE